MMLFTLGGFFKSIISSFKTRVLNDGGTFEAETNLENQLNNLGSTLFNSASLVITPNGVKTSKLYTIKPNDVTGDLTVVRNTSATRIDENGNIVNVPANVARIDYSNGSPAILVEPQRTNIAFPNNQSAGQGSNFSFTLFNPNEFGQGIGGTYYEHQAGFNTAISGFNINNIAPNLTGFTTRYISCIVKNPSSRYMRCSLVTGGVIFWVDFQTLTTSTAESKIISIGNNTYLLIGIAENRTDNISNFRVGLVGNMSSKTSVSGNFILGGVMVFASNTPFTLSPSSLILTTTSEVTRNADVISKTGLSGISSITETFDNGTTNIISGNPTNYTMSQGRIKQVIGVW